MVQDDEEIAAGAALPVGVALIHAGGQGGSFEIAVTRAPLLAAPVERAISDASVHVRMHIDGQISTAGPNLRQVQMLLREPDFAEQAFRLLQSLAVAPGPSLDVLLPTLQTAGRLRRTNQTEPLTATLRAVLQSCLLEIASGAGWPFDRTAAAETALFAVYDGIIASLSRRSPPDEVGAGLRAAWDEACTVGIYPFPQCFRVCPEFVCRYRHVAKRLAVTGPLRSAWSGALAGNSDAALWPALADVAERAVERGLSGTGGMEHGTRLAACFVLHSLDLTADLEQVLRDKVFRNVLAELLDRVAKTPSGR
jgi:hypothetical protein